jgi:hypothetical protein
MVISNGSFIVFWRGEATKTFKVGEQIPYELVNGDGSEASRCFGKTTISMAWTQEIPIHWEHNCTRALDIKIQVETEGNESRSLKMLKMLKQWNHLCLLESTRGGSREWYFL